MKKFTILLLPIIAFLLPVLYYGGIFTGRSFGLECATGLMGFKPPYNQTSTSPNPYCLDIADIGAYAWNHYPLWVKTANQYLNFQFPLWNQNNGIGAPLAANFISTAYFIPNILFAIPNNVFSFDIYFLLRFSIASLGMYLFLRTFKIPEFLCLIGSLVVFLNGYVTYIPTISHLDVDILLPWIAYLINKSFATRKIKYFIALSLVTALSNLGGMPEASIFIVFFFVSYTTFLSLVATNKELRRKTLLSFGAVFVLSILLSGILIIPGFEYILQGTSYHQPGMSQAASVDFRNIIFWPFPRLFGELYRSYSNTQHFLTFGIWNMEYTGSFSFFLLISSLFLITLKRKTIKALPYYKQYLFFFFFLVIILIQYFDLLQNPLFTKLPGFSQTNFPKYSLTIINFSIATIATFTIYYIIKKRLNSVLIKSVLAMAILTIVVYRAFGNIAINAGIYNHFVKQLFLSDSIVLLLSGLILFKNMFKIKPTLLYILLFFIAAVEFYPYIPHRGDLQRRDSFKTPPAINYLSSLDYKESRIFSPDSIMYPNLSAMFNINDIRNLDAIWPKNYYNYLKYFIVPDIDNRGMRFTGLQDNGSTEDAKVVHNVFFDLTSTKYILSYSDVRGYEDLQKLAPYLAQIKPSPALRTDIFTINNYPRGVLFEHPPAKISLSVNKPEGAKYFYLYPGISPQAFENTDGVGFKATVISDGKELFEQELEIKPKDNPGDQKWFDMQFGPFDDNIKSFDLVLETDPLQNNASDWAGWGGFEWDTEKGVSTTSQYKKIYDKEMKIFENSNFVPRLHPITSIKCATNSGNITEQMKDSESEIRNIGIVLSKSCKPEQFATNNISLIGQNFDDQKVSFTYSSPHKSYIILSNNYYPGWKLKINGKEQPIDLVNYTFQGLRLPKGENLKIEVVYEPLSFKIGFISTTLALGLCFFGLVKYRNRKI
ncbi:MAG: YfhO family protein [Patescibacteria group bacterium]|nr:YfhO family protein [Patescibacteria group bacterium]